MQFVGQTINTSGFRTILLLASIHSLLTELLCSRAGKCVDNGSLASAEQWKGWRLHMSVVMNTTSLQVTLVPQVPSTICSQNPLPSFGLLLLGFVHHTHHCQGTTPTPSTNTNTSQH